MKKRILLVDDDPDYTFFVSHRLQKAGYECQTALSAPEGLQKTKAFHPDLIVLDLLMPKMSGYGFLREVKQVEGMEDVPVIVCSSLRDREIMNEAQDLGAKDYITKSCDEGLIIKKISELVQAT